MLNRVDQRSTDNFLGLFARGIPGIFVRNDVYVRASREMQEYARFYKASRKDATLNEKFCTPTLCKGFELSCTVLHEVKHFHDSLLCRPLFELFVEATRRALATGQLAGKIRGLRAPELPLSVAELSRRAGPLLSEILSHLSNLDSRYAAAYESVARRCTVGGKEISIESLLEGSAVALELANAVSLHGWEAAHYYRENVIKRLPAIYNDVLDLIVNRAGSLETGLSVAHLLLASALYDDDDPVSTFSAVFGDVNGPIHEAVYRATEQISGLFRNEAELESHIARMGIMANGQKIDMRKHEGQPLGNLALLPKLVMRARAAMIEKYVNEWQLATHKYLEYVQELPIPPSIMFPYEANGDVMLIPYGAFREPVHVIAGLKDESDNYTAIGCAVISTNGMPSFVPHDVVDFVMLMAYCWSRLMKRGDAGYGILADEMYERFFTKYFLAHGVTHGSN